MKDIMSNGYRAGGNVKFFGKSGREEEDSYADEVADRLNLSNDDDNEGAYASLMAFPACVDQVETLQNEITITSRLLPYDVQSQKNNSFPGGEQMYQLLKTRYGLDHVHFGEDLRASESMAYMSQGSVNNSLCFSGPHRKYDPRTKHYTVMQPGMGHWGSDARPGVSLE